MEQNRSVVEMATKTCDECRQDFPLSKFNPESFSPGLCFRCRVSGVQMGFVGGKSTFHGDTLVGGTIASDNRHTVDLARSNGHDPVPMKTAGGVGVTSRELDKLKSVSSFKGKKD